MAYIYKTKEGDSLLTIAEQFGLSPKQLQQINGVTTVSRGQQIKIPGGAGGAAGGLGSVTGRAGKSQNTYPPIQGKYIGADYFKNPVQILPDKAVMYNAVTGQQMPSVSVAAQVSAPQVSAPTAQNQIPGALQYATPNTVPFSGISPLYPTYSMNRRPAAPGNPQGNPQDAWNAMYNSLYPYMSMGIAAGQRTAYDPITGNYVPVSPAASPTTAPTTATTAAPTSDRSIGGYGIENANFRGEYAERGGGIRGDKWEVKTYKDENGNWVKRTQRAGRRRGMPRFSEQSQPEQPERSTQPTQSEQQKNEYLERLAAWRIGL